MKRGRNEREKKLKECKKCKELQRERDGEGEEDEEGQNVLKRWVVFPTRSPLCEDYTVGADHKSRFLTEAGINQTPAPQPHQRSAFTYLMNKK